MRLSGFVIFNTPIALICLFTRNQTPLFNAFMQWVNQTYNAGLNYGNRNASSNLTNQELATGYLSAVFVSCSTAIVSRMALANKLAQLKGPRLIIASAALNYSAAALSGAANLFMIRRKEMSTGISVQDETGEKTYGTSKLAAKRAVQETAFTRFFLPGPVLFFPALANFAIHGVGLWPKHNVASKLMEASLCALSLSVGLPMSIALFQQRSQAQTSQLEEEFQTMTDDNGQPIKVMFFNKGM